MIIGWPYNDFGHTCNYTAVKSLAVWLLLTTVNCIHTTVLYLNRFSAVLCRFKLDLKLQIITKTNS